MEKYKCKLCFRLFNNGRALGGHMKSHLAKLPKKQKEEEEKQKELEEEEDCSSLSTSNNNNNNTSQEEDVAMSLMMLSRDTWHCFDSVELKQYKCEVCDKVFKSTQALGGHRTSHKKPKRDGFFGTRFVPKKFTTNKKKYHECPICNKVFGSGQALGGHKRSHFLISPVVNNNNNNNNASSSVDFGDGLEDDKSVKSGDNWIDLNMPAPTEEDDDEEMSAVSVAEFNYYC